MKVQKILLNDRITILADSREMSSRVVSYLKEYDAHVIKKCLDVGDYVVSEHVGIERKTIQDFLQSVINQRLFKQMENLTNTFEKPVLIIEGDPEKLFLERNMHPNTIRGVLSSIVIDYRIPILWTPNQRETASQIYWMAKREQTKAKKEIQIRANKKCYTTSELQEFIVAGLPNVSTVLSRRLLKEFKTIRKIFTASPEKLMKVPGLGKKKARLIWDILNKEYED